MKIWFPEKSPSTWVEHEHEQDEVVPCPITSQHQACWRSKGSLQFAARNPIPDFLKLVSNWVISKKAYDLLQREKISGFETRPATVREKLSHGRLGALHDAYEIVVTGWGGLIHAATGSQPISQCPGCGFTEFSRIESMETLFDETQWDRSDFFKIWPIGEYVTDRVKAVVEEHCLTGVDFLPLESRKKTLATHLAFNPPSAAGLRWILPEPRAKEIGKPLGIY